MIKIENANAEVEAAMEMLGTDPLLSRTFKLTFLFLKKSQKI